jgi:hypothetical protein
MENKLKKIAKSKSKLTWVALFAMALAISSCTKSGGGSSGAAQFIGTWNMTSSCGGSAPVTFSGSGNTITTPGNVGTPGCAKPITYTGTVSGNGFTIPTTTYTDNCGNSYTVSGVGTLNGGTLTFTLTVGGFGTCTLTGTK